MPANDTLIATTTATVTESPAPTEPVFTGGYRQAELTMPTGLADYTIQTLPEPYGYYYTKVIVTGNDLDNKISISPAAPQYTLELRGGAGNDQLTGGEGADTLSGGAGADTLRGGLGDDTYVIDNVGDVIIEPTPAEAEAIRHWGTSGTDTVISSLNYKLTDDKLENLTLTGSAKLGAGNALNNVLTASDQGSSLSGLSGDDTLIGGQGNDTLDGGDGSDAYTLNGGTDLVGDTGLTGMNTLSLGLSVDPNSVRLIRSERDLVVEYDARPGVTQRSVATVSNYFDTSTSLTSSRWQLNINTSDNSSLFPSYPVDVISTLSLVSEGDDVLQLDQGQGLILMGGGNDLVSIFGGYSAVAGGLGNDTIDGHAAMAYIAGGEGNDSIWGATSLYGGAGDDYLGVVVNARLADGGAGNNTYKLGDGARYLTVNSSDDISVNTIRFQAGPNGLAARPEDIQISGQGETYIDLHQAGTSTYANVRMTAGQTWQVAFDNGVVWKAADLIALTHTATEGKDTLSGLSGNDTFSGKGGDDYLTGDAGNDLLSGDDGNDTLYGGVGNDTLIGGAGNDSLRGQEGSDTYVVGRQGNDEIDLYQITPYVAAQDMDVLQFTDGIKASDVSINVENSYGGLYSALTLTYQGGSVKVINFFLNEPNASLGQFKEFVFGDGERWDQARLQTLCSLGTNNNDVLVASVSGGLIEGLGGDDVLIGKNGATTLLGGAGDDTLYASSSSSTTLRGGAGNDSIAAGGEQADRIYFDSGDGHDTADLGVGDTVVFGPGLSRSALSLEVLPITAGANRFKLSFGLNDSLILSTNGGSYNPETLPLVNFEFSDGSNLTGTDLLKLNPGYKFGSSGADVVQGTSSAETLLGLSGKDTLIGGQGNDSLIGGKEEDTFVFNRGDGADVVLTAASDVYSPIYFPELTVPDVLSLGTGIRPDDLVFSKVEGGYQVKVLNGSKDVGDSITILAPGMEYTNIVFADGYRYKKETIGLILDGYIRPGGTLIGTQGNDTLVSYQGATQVQGLGGNDRIVVGPSDDLIDGGAGDDTLVIKAAMGFDTYDSHGDAAGDVIELTDAYNLSDFAIVLAEPTSGSTDATLNLWRKDSAGALTIVDHLASGQSRATPVSGLPGLRQSDGTFFSAADLYARRQQATAGSDTLYAGNIAGVVLDGGAGADTFVLSGLAKDVKIKADASDTIDLTAGPGRNDLSAKVVEQGGKAQLSLENWDTDKVVLTLLDAEAALDTRVRFSDGQTTTVRALAGQYISVPYPSVSAQLQGWFGNDTINGGSASETLMGREGDDRLYAGDLPDTLIGGLGNDLMEGQSGADTYVYDRGDGQDTIVAGIQDIIRFGAGIAASDLVVGALGASAPGAVVLQIKRPDGAATDSITLSDAMVWQGLRFHFADGSALVGGAGLSLQASTIGAGTIYRDDLVGTDQSDTLLGLGADDALIGGKGDDVLEGGEGADQYLFNRGDGADVIRIKASDIPPPAPPWAYYAAVETLFFGADIGMGDLALKDVSGGYQITVLKNGQATGDSITVLTPSNDALSISFDDGKKWSGYQVASYLGTLVPSMDGDDVLDGTEQADTLRGMGGQDTLTGGKGNDLLEGGAGADTYRYSRGDGQDVIRISASDDLSAGADTLQLGADIRMDDLQLRSTSTGYEIGLLHGAVGTSDLISVETVALDALSLAFADGNRWSGVDVVSFLGGASVPGGTLTGTEVDDALNAFRGNTQLFGLGGNDALTGHAGNDTLDGGDGNDTLVGGAGDDEISGGRGNNLLEGGAGADAYQLFTALGFQDTLRADDADSIVVGGTRTTMSVGKLGATGDKQVRVTFKDVQGNVSTLTLLDAGQWDGLQVTVGTQAYTGAQIMALATKPDDLTLTGTAGSDNLAGKDGNDTLLGLAGDDILAGSTGQDRYEGGAGDDRLTDEGALTIDGQQSIHGNGGADTYVYNLGDGKDIVIDSSLSTQEDVLLFGAGITLADISVLRRTQPTSDMQPPMQSDALPLYFSNDEVFVVKGQGEVAFRAPGSNVRSTVVNVSAGNWTVERLQFNDGTSLDRTGIDALFANAATSQTGSGANDSLLGQGGNDSLSGKAGNDSLSGGAGNDWLSGGVGSDVLEGGAGADTYAYSRGDGADTLRADGQDTIVFDATIKKTDIVVGKLGASAANTVALQVRNGTTATSDSLTLDNAGTWAGLQLKFADGSSLTWADILLAATKPENLTLNGTTKADTLTGKDGNDTLNGLAGNDTLAGGKGNDSLIGGKGNDTYLFNRGEGQDTIVDNDSTWFNSDLLKVGGATSKQLWLTKSGSNLDIKILGTTDKVTVQNWFAGSANQVEKITASDGKSLSASKVQALVNAMASFTPPSDVASLPANTPTAVTKLIASSWA